MDKLWWRKDPCDFDAMHNLAAQKMMLFKHSKHDEFQSSFLSEKCIQYKHFIFNMITLREVSCIARIAEKANMEFDAIYAEETK